MTTTRPRRTTAHRTRHRINAFSISLLTLFAALILVACGAAESNSDVSEDGTDTAQETSAATTDTEAEETTTETDTNTESENSDTENTSTENNTKQADFGIGQAAIDNHVEWIVGVLNDASAIEDPATEQQAAQRFNQAFLAQVPASAVLAQIEQLQATVSTTWTVVESNEFSPNGRETVLDIGQPAEPWQLAIMVDDTGLIEGAQISPTPEVAEAVSYDQVAKDAQVYGQVSMLVAEIVDGSCEVIHDTGAETVTPLGSTFKLYVLAAVADAVANGEASWDDPLPIQDELKSLPSGTYQNLDAGTERTVLEHAQAMIGASDNTATDHLIDLVGRRAVEAQLDALGNSVPERNQPFLTTRELFIVKLQFDDSERATYLALDTEERRAFLDEIDPLTAVVADAVDWTDPIEVETLEWFATPLDQCRALTILATGGSAEVRDIVSTNAPVDPAEFPYAAFKGGSEPGVLNLAFLVERPDGRSFALIGNITNTAETIPETAASASLASALELIAQE